jgi:hypothetical protein
MAYPDQDLAVQFLPPAALDGTQGVVWLAYDGRRTTTQVATNVRVSNGWSSCPNARQNNHHRTRAFNY